MNAKDLASLMGGIEFYQWLKWIESSQKTWLHSSEVFLDYALKDLPKVGSMPWLALASMWGWETSKDPR